MVWLWETSGQSYNNKKYKSNNEQLIYKFLKSAH
jgi:hypothetical protein